MALTYKSLWDNELREYYGAKAGGRWSAAPLDPEYRKQANLRQQGRAVSFT
jgi:hypothetical protein